MGKEILYSLKTPPDKTVVIKGEKPTLQWRNLVDTTLIK